MTMKTVVAGLLAGLLVSGNAFAQAAAPAAPAAPAVTAPPAAAPMATPTDKKAVAKMCSDEATKKGLHGKERKTFRAACKRGKMNGAM